MKKLLFLIIIILLLTANANALGIREEDIWIFQGAYELGLGERAYLEGFTIKVHELNSGNNAATLLIYRNSVFKEDFVVDTGLNNEYTYNSELRIELIEINDGRVSLEMYKKKTELVWVTDIPKTAFQIGDTLTGDNYAIILDAINEEGALITVEHNGETFEGTYKSGDNQKFSEDFMINVVYLKRNTEEVFIETLKPGEPVIKIDVADLKDSYESNEYAEYELIVNNNGTIPLHGIILTTQSDDGSVEQASQQHSILDQGKSTKFQIQMKPEISPLEKNISIISKAQGYDYRGNEYNGEITVLANIKPYISIKKEITSMEKPSKDREFGTEQYFQISITVENKASFQTAVTVTDELPRSFIPDDLDDTEWTVVVGAGETKTIDYFASPTEPGDFSFSPAEVLWTDGGETYKLESEESTEVYHVSGSKLIVTKDVSSSYMLVGEEITVFIRASNDGDRAIEISFREDIPEELDFVHGDNMWQGTLKAGDGKEFSYTVKGKSSGEIYLPVTVVSYTDEDNNKDKTESEEVFLYIDEAKEEEEPYTEEYVYDEVPATEDKYEKTEKTEKTNADLTGLEAAGFLASSFVALFLIIAIIPAFAYLYIIRIYK